MLLILPNTSPVNVKAFSDHPNLIVSAENSVFVNHFFGPMVVEVIVRDDNRQLDQAQGEPIVTVNGRNLRMIQSSDGNWYAFFANVDKAKQADQIAISVPGQSLDFGVFCSGSTPSTILGADFSQTDGVAIPDSAGLSGTTQGAASLTPCSGTPLPPTNQNNVVRYTPSLNTNANVPVGQIGINQNAWPLIQLFSFSNSVNVEYNRAGGTQSVDLTYFDIPNITLQLDRTKYPSGSEVLATINDNQLDIDPTSPDSWTFNVGSPEATFYQAFAEAGTSASGSGFINLLPSLSSLGFHDNGHLKMDLGDVVNLKTNSLQTSTSITANSITYNKLVTFVETGPNTGIFESSLNSISTIGILPNAPRSNSGSIHYNLQGVSIVSGVSTASLSVGNTQSQFNPGQKKTITLVDNVQNLNYDFRSFQKQLGINSFSDTSMTLHSGGLPGTSSVQIIAPGTIISGNGLVQISDTAIASIESVPSTLSVFVEINFGTSGNISNENDSQPIVFDLFSFGSKDNQNINNAVYRAELQETSSNSGIFSGTMEYAITNQLNQFDPNLIKNLRTFGSNIKFLVNEELTDNKSPKFSILSSQVGGQETIVTAMKAVPTHTGTVTLDSPSYRLGQTVTITVYDPDLNTEADTIQSYTTVNDQGSPADDTIGDNSGNILLEVWIKGFRFHHCTINGVPYGGLAATGFTLTETAPGSGTFKGSFKMPTQICSEDGTSLISPIGGSVEAWYHDFMDEKGSSVIIGSKVFTASSSYTTNNPTQYRLVKLTQISDDSGRPLLQSPLVGQTINFKTLITNYNIKSQTLSYIVQVKDNQNKIVFLKWLDDNIQSSSTNSETISWKPTMSGNYHVEIFLWEGMNSLIPLTEEQEYALQILS